MGSIEKAKRFAWWKHLGQKYGKEPYYNHLLRVHERVCIAAPDDENLQVAAILHDILEDTNTSVFDLSYKFGHEVACLVQALTRGPFTTYQLYIHGLDKDAKIIKIADIQDHLHHNPPERLRVRYERALERLTRE